VRDGHAVIQPDHPDILAGDGFLKAPLVRFDYLIDEWPYRPQPGLGSQSRNNVLRIDIPANVYGFLRTIGTLGSCSHRGFCQPLPNAYPKYRPECSCSLGANHGIVTAVSQDPAGGKFF
jgi:hypothetical protein